MSIFIFIFESRTLLISFTLKNAGLFFMFIIFCGQDMISQEKANMRFSVKLSQFQSISLNKNQSTVTINLVDQADFENGKTAIQQNHIKIISTSEYQVKVSASSELVGKTTTIPVNTLSVIPSLGDLGSPDPIIQFKEVALSTGEQAIINSFQGDLERSFNIAYDILGGAKYMNQPAGNYNTTITYNILPL